MRPNIGDAYYHEQVYLNYFGFGDLASRRFLPMIALVIPNVSHMFAMFWQIVTKFGDPEMVQVILYFGTHVGAIWKLFNFILKNETLVKIEKLLKKPSFNAHESRNDGFIAVSNYRLILLSKVFKNSVYFTVTLFAILGLLNSSLPFGGIYLPNQERYYYFVFCFQLAGTYQIAVCNGTFDCVAIVLMQLGSNQFDVLKFNLQDIKHIGDKQVFQKFRTQVEFHNDILEYCELVEDLLNNGIFAQFMSSAMSICFSMLQLILISLNFKMFIILMYLSCILCQLCMYCWFGHFTLVKSTEVMDACYMSDWYKCNPKMKSLFFMVMERAKKPTYFTAGKFFTLSLSTFVAILKSSYSYFAVLQRMYDQ